MLRLVEQVGLDDQDRPEFPGFAAPAGFEVGKIETSTQQQGSSDAGIQAGLRADLPLVSVSRRKPLYLASRKTLLIAVRSADSGACGRI